MIHGNIDGIKKSTLDELEKLYDAEFERDEFLPERLMNLLTQVTTQINREVMVYVTRDGDILEIAIGSIGHVSLPERHLRRNRNRLAGIRCIHTHPGGNAYLSDVDEQALRLMRFDAMCAIGVSDGHVTGVSAAFLGDVEYGKLSIATFGPVKPGRIPQALWLDEVEESDRRVANASIELDIVEQAEKALLISIDTQESLDELEALAETAGAVVVGREIQKRQKPDTATYIGSGKVEELSLAVQAQEIDLVIIDDELTGAQQRNLEKMLGTRVIDRTALILDIFAARAQSREGKLQVELAQLKYRMPRLYGQGTILSRLGGGIGTRGPGETQLEVDKRRIRKRVDDLSRELKELSKQRAMRRTRRQKAEQVTVALVGYTNTGKSTLLNALSGSDVLVEDKLFATLDPVVRKIELNDTQSCLLVDTVGFIHKLPHPLVQAFKSTLEEALEADLLVIVSDLSSPFYIDQRDVVYHVLDELGAGSKPVIEALNKCDKALPDIDIEPRDALRISAQTGFGLDALKEAIAQKIAKLRIHYTCLIPYNKGNALNLLHNYAQIITEEYLEHGVQITCMADSTLKNRVEKMLGDG